MLPQATAQFSRRVPSCVTLPESEEREEVIEAGHHSAPEKIPRLDACRALVKLVARSRKSDPSVSAITEPISINRAKVTQAVCFASTGLCNDNDNARKSDSRSSAYSDGKIECVPTVSCTGLRRRQAAAYCLVLLMLRR